MLIIAAAELKPRIGLNMAKAKDKIFGLYQRFHNHADSKGFGFSIPFISNDDSIDDDKKS